jgi:hypothetical protein
MSADAVARFVATPPVNEHQMGNNASLTHREEPHSQAQTATSESKNHAG